MTPVIFKYERDSDDVTAFFPTLPADYAGNYITCYAHLGQHSSASPEILRLMKPAPAEAYEPLLRELRGQGYDDLVIVRRMTRKHVNERLKAARG
jgi:hypothetical protein